jgi:ribonuclease G
LPWFRRKKTSLDDAATPAAQEITPPASPPVTEPPAAESPAEGAEALARKRRRGSRGGRGRKKPAAAGGAGTDADEKVETTAAPTRQQNARGGRSEESRARADGRKKASQQASRRRQPPRRAPLPAAKRELLISVDVGEQRVAILEDDRVAEVYLERPERRSIAGNIYLGVVDNVLPGMEAAFVEIGLEKNGFLYVDEIVVPELEGKRHGKKIQDLISRGEKLLVQAVKDPMKTKGARLTTEISLPGRFLVFVPNGEGLGVSRRLDDGERVRLKDILKSIAPEEGGVIVRTAAEGASAEDVERDLVFLQRLWKTIEARAKGATAPELLYQEAELPLRIVRDLFTGDFVSAHVDNDRAYKRIVGYLKKTSPHMLERVHRDKEREGLFERFGVEKEIASTLERRVDLPSGGYLIFDYAEAFTVIDVNTGRFVGSRSKTSTQRLEDTIVKNNLEAVKEVVRQLRLRDIGGIIVIDFIDMANPKNRQAVEEALRNELERDRTKTYVVEISPLGLVEMTRQNVTDGPREVMTRKCPTCAGDGIVVSDATTAMIVERKLRALATAGSGSRVQAYKVAVNPRTLSLLVGSGGDRLAELEEATRRRFFLVSAEGHTHGDYCEVLAEGKLEDLRPDTPVAEGAELELKLGEIGLHDATTASAKFEGIDVIVADAAKLVGKKANVRIGRALEGQAFASLVATGEKPAAITFESEAEKPTRAPARRKSTSEPSTEIEDGAIIELVESDVDDLIVLEETAEEELGTAEIADDEELEDGDGHESEEAPADGEEGLDGAAVVKKRTRRGSRGGRRRKKRPVGAPGVGENGAAAGADEEDLDEDTRGTDVDAVPALAAAADGEAGGSEPPTPRPTPARRRAPRIHVPEGDRPADGRVPAAAAAAAAVVSSGPPVEAASEVVVETPADSAVAGGAVAADGVQEDGNGVAPVKRKTRRGSRGGRNRRKRPVGQVGAEVGESDGVDDPSSSEIAADEHAGQDLPAPATLIRPPGRPRERAQRPAAVVTSGSDDTIPVSPGVEHAPVDGAPEQPESPKRSPRSSPKASPDAREPAGSSEPGDEAGYVPMSEWIEDFDARGR